MDRLTKRVDGGISVTGKPTTNVGITTTLSEWFADGPTKCLFAIAARRLAALEDKLERGELVEVVRCGECRFRGDHDCPMTIYNDFDELNDWTKDNGFCYKGKRKEAKA